MSKRPHDELLEDLATTENQERPLKKHTLDSDEEDEDVDSKKYNLMDPEEIEGGRLTCAGSEATAGEGCTQGGSTVLRGGVPCFSGLLESGNTGLAHEAPLLASWGDLSRRWQGRLKGSLRLSEEGTYALPGTAPTRFGLLDPPVETKGSPRNCIPLSVTVCCRC